MSYILLHKYHHNYFSRQRITGNKDANILFRNLHSLETSLSATWNIFHSCFEICSPKLHLSTTVDSTLSTKKKRIIKYWNQGPYTATRGYSIDEMINILIISVTFEILVSLREMQLIHTHIIWNLLKHVKSRGHFPWR